METDQCEIAIYLHQMMRKVKQTNQRDLKGQHCVDIFNRLCDTFAGREFLRNYPGFLPVAINRLRQFVREPFWGKHFENHLRIICMIQRKMDENLPSVCIW